MKAIMSHISALEYWKSVRLSPHAFWPVTSTPALLSAPPELRTPDELEGMEVSAPVHVLVGNHNARRSSGYFTSHVRKGKLPRGSIVHIEDELYVCSPELTFVQMATMVELPELIRIGFELCGKYDDSSNSVLSCDPLTRIRKLSAYVERAEGVFGREKALRALKYLADNSASPRETILTMLLCLPYRLGGYRIEMPRLNYRIDLSKEAKKIAHKGYCECDLYWPRFKFAVEYDSNEFHTGAERIADDSSRRAALAKMGIAVVAVTNRQLYDSGRFNKLAHFIAENTGKRLQYKDPEFTRSHFRLRKLLFEELDRRDDRLSVHVR